MAIKRKRPARPARRPNDPTVLILTSLATAPRHGYALIGDIEDFAGTRLGPGTLYGAISRLEGEGLIEAVGATGRRRPYRITPAGTESLQRTLAEMSAIVATATARLSGAPTPAVSLIAGAV